MGEANTRSTTSHTWGGEESEREELEQDIDGVRQQLKVVTAD